jgi:hypothetical protein
VRGAAVSVSIPVHWAGPVVREAIEWIGGKRAKIGDAASHSCGCDRYGVIAIAMPVPPRVAPRITVGIVAYVRTLGGRRSAGWGLGHAGRWRRLTQ